MDYLFKSFSRLLLKDGLLNPKPFEIDPQNKIVKLGKKIYSQGNSKEQYFSK